MSIFSPKKRLSAPLAARRAGLFALPVFLSACAVQQAAAPPPARLAVAPGYASGQALELDGLPAQEAPSIERRRTPDDPKEPFSPNYGRRLITPAPVLPSAAGRDDLPWLEKQQQMSALTE